MLFLCSDSCSAICKTAASLTLIAVIASPLYKIKTDAADIIKSEYFEVQKTAQNARRQALELQSSTAANKIAEYAQIKAAEDNINITVKISAYADENNNFKIEKAAVTYADRSSYLKKSAVADILLHDCGIAEQNQEHIAQQTG